MSIKHYLVMARAVHASGYNLPETFQICERVHKGLFYQERYASFEEFKADYFNPATR